MIRRGLILLSATRSIARNARPLSLSAMKLSEKDNAGVSEGTVSELFSKPQRQDFHNQSEKKGNAYSENHIQLIGGVTQDPVVKVSASSNNKYTVMKVATNIYHKKANGEFVTHTDFHEVVAFGRNANFVEERIKKGHRVYVTGRLGYNKITTPDGFQFDKPSIVAEVVHHFGTRIEKQ